MPFIIGVTGAVGVGKSTVLSWLSRRGVPALDADRVVHGLLAEDAATIAAVSSRFGDVRTEDGRIDRALLGARVFADKGALDDLEALIHPRVIDVFRTSINASTARITAVEAVKLVESGMGEACDEIWLVTCRARIRRGRLTDRGWTVDEIDRRMSASPPTAVHLAAATRVIDNGGSSAATERQVERAFHDAIDRLDTEDRT